MPRPAVIKYPQSIQSLKQGVDLLADLLATTLGPSQGVVLSSTELKPKPEILTDAATIARRVTEVPDPLQNVGVMLLRNLVWRMHERAGDGGAIAAVLAQSILHHALRSVIAGANPMDVWNGIRLAKDAACRQLEQLSRPVKDEDDLAAVALAATGQEKLSWILGEMFDLLGPGGYVTVEDYVAPYLDRVYLDGGRWLGQLASPYLATGVTGKSVLHDSKVLLYGDVLTSAEDARAIIELAGAEKLDGLLVVAQRVGEDALNILTSVHSQGKLKICAVGLKRAGEKAESDLHDLAILSGATLLSPVLGRRLANLRPEDLGKTRRAEAGKEDLLLVGGGGSPEIVRKEIEILQHRLDALEPDDDGRDELEQRLARLSGSAAILQVGAYTQTERDYLKQVAGRGAKVCRAALEEGILPGGGASYLRCIPPVQTVVAQVDGDIKMGAHAVLRALEAPARRILQNAGIESPSLILQNIQEGKDDQVFDVISKRIASARDAGLLDTRRTLYLALETAASGAAIALTTDTVILKRTPKVSYEP